ncbi:MAG: hypothetical protein JSV22_04930 [Bacteroidales bacterium]|nr:MAG: hypothetical protein JSV22_04930 [Bacteroidales bacterium]
MLNKRSRIICFSLASIICSAFGQNYEIKILRLKDALDLAHSNLPDTFSETYDNNIKSAYYCWIYNHNRFKVLNEKKLLYKDFMVISGLHFKSGEIDLLKKSLAEIEYFKIESQYSDARHDLLISENNLKKLLYTSDSIIPENDSLTKYYPEDIKTGKYAQDIMIDNYEDFAAQNDYQGLKLLLEKYDKQLEYYEEILLFAQQLIKTTRLKYISEDIEYFHYINIISRALDFKVEYLETLNLFNQTALKIEMYTD